ncbi:putative peptide synthetase [Podospora australis]|uniref:Peptide synthetase n=1 Tax=Podospora australis TaxID=1536484 RepID=A0AAN6WLM9_9PEZI|nr:putative peptide synthetase [Podospora australis]
MLSPSALVDHLAATKPNDTWVKIPITSAQDVTHWDNITWAQLSNAVNAMAHFITKSFGPARKDEPIAYTGINDIRYPIVILAAIKADYKAVLTSPRNSTEGNLALLKATACTKFVFTKEFRASLIDISSKSPSQLHIAQVPDLDDILTPSSPVFTSVSDLSMENRDTVMILHTSGTTGLPKPVYIKAGVFNTTLTINDMPAPPGRESIHNKLFGTRLALAVTPFFHIFGINMLLRSIHFQKPLVLLPPSKPPTAELVVEAITKTKPSALICPPSVIEDLCKLPSALPALESLEFVFFGGAPLSHAAGTKIIPHTRLYNGIGSTEAFFYPAMVPQDPNDWEYFEWTPGGGLTMELSEEEPDLAELVVKRTKGEEWQFAFHNFPELNEWRTHDLFERHHTKPNLWRFLGRLDDVIVLSNGEKANPVAFEKHIEGSPLVKGALVVGVGHFQTGLLVEPLKQPDDPGRFVDEIWPVVEEANKQYPAYARVWRSMVMLSHPNKPFNRTAKGSVMRRATYQLYDHEIEELYAKQQQSTGAIDIPCPNRNTLDLVRSAISSVVGNKTTLKDDTNIFSLGADSLQALQVSRILASSGLACSAKKVYDNPTIITLSQALSSPSTDQTSKEPTPISREEKMSKTIYRHTHFASLPTPVSIGHDRHNLSILLIGSTGSLGSYLLQSLLAQSSPSPKIYCLNRSPNAPTRQKEIFTSRGLPNFDMSPITFLNGETSLPNFGLDPSTFSDLQTKVDVMILNAWPVNFNAPLESFESVISGTKRCVDFSTTSPRHPHIVFISSIASVLNYPAVRHDPEIDDSNVVAIPEIWDPDNSLPARQGYGESKHVAAVILDKAFHGGYLEKAPAVLRVGQLAGAVEGSGVWKKQEWLPSLIKTSVSLGKIPSSLPGAPVDWVPVDVAARAVIDIAVRRFSSPAISSPVERESKDDATECFNLVNPHSASWENLVHAVQRYYSQQGQEITTVEFDGWLSTLQKISAAGATDEDIERMPALKLMDFFEGLAPPPTDTDKQLKVVFGTDRVLEASPAMRGLGAIDGKMMNKWLKEWNF